MFALHLGQCAVLVHAADALATAFVVPHPDDYRAPHTTLIKDLYGELVHPYALLSAAVPDFVPRLPDVATLAELRPALAAERRGGPPSTTRPWPPGPARSRIHRPDRLPRRRLHPAALPATPFRPRQDNHIGEAITAPDGRIAYLKTFRLSEAQIRSGHLLTRLAAPDWHLGATAADLGPTDGRGGASARIGVVRLLLRPEVPAAYRRAEGARPLTDRGRRVDAAGRPLTGPGRH